MGIGSDNDYIPHTPRIGKHLKLGDRLDQITTGVLVWCPLCGHDSNKILHKIAVQEVDHVERSDVNHVFRCEKCGHKIKFQIEGVQ